MIYAIGRKDALLLTTAVVTLCFTSLSGFADSIDQQSTDVDTAVREAVIKQLEHLQTEEKQRIRNGLQNLIKQQAQPQNEIVKQLSDEARETSLEQTTRTAPPKPANSDLLRSNLQKVIHSALKKQQSDTDQPQPLEQEAKQINQETVSTETAKDKPLQKIVDIEEGAPSTVIITSEETSKPVDDEIEVSNAQLAPSNKVDTQTPSLIPLKSYQDNNHQVEAAKIPLNPNEQLNPSSALDFRLMPNQQETVSTAFSVKQKSESVNAQGRNANTQGSVAENSNQGSNSGWIYLGRFVEGVWENPTLASGIELPKAGQQYMVKAINVNVRDAMPKKGQLGKLLMAYQQNQSVNVLRVKASGRNHNYWAEVVLLK